MKDPANAVAAGTSLMTADEMPRMRARDYCLKTGITRTPEFVRKGLACFAVNVGLKCGHDCLYCSSGAVLRTHPAFRELGENPFHHGYSIVDPSVPERVARDAARIRERGLIQLCTLTVAWAPEAKKHELGRRCLEVILSQPGWSVRILTKNAAVVEDFDLIEQHRDPRNTDGSVNVVEHVDLYIREHRGRLKTRSLNIRINALKTFLTWARKSGRVRTNPIAEVPRAGRPGSSERVLDVPEVEALLAASPEPYRTIHDNTRDLAACEEIGRSSSCISRSPPTA